MSLLSERMARELADVTLVTENEPLPVDVTVVVEVVETFEDVFEHRSNRDLVKNSRLTVLGFHLVLDDVQKTADFKQPEYEPKLILDHEAGEVLDHVLVVAAAHGLDLLEELVHVGVPLLQVDPLDGAPLVAGEAERGMDHSGGALADHLLQLVVTGMVWPLGGWRRRGVLYWPGLCHGGGGEVMDVTLVLGGEERPTGLLC